MMVHVNNNQNTLYTHLKSQGINYKYTIKSDWESRNVSAKAFKV